MDMLRVLLNNTEANHGVQGLGDIVEELELKRELHGYLYQVQGTITFVQSDYEYLRGLFVAGYCEDVILDIQESRNDGDTWNSKIKALIKLAGVKWDRVQQTAECPIVDNSYQSKINNNRQIEFQLGNHSGTVLSKNGVDVSSKVVFHSRVQLFAPFRGRYFEDESYYTDSANNVINLIPSGRVGMFIWDALNLLVAMMTDDEVDFVSDYFSYDISDLSAARDEAVSMIMTGGHIRHGSTYPKLNFEQTFNDLHKLCNVWFAMEYTSGGKPRIRIENEEYFRQSNSGVYFNNVSAFVESVNLGNIYSKVVLGCSVSSSSNFPVGEIPLVHHVQEEYPLSGTCNTNNELNLRLEKLIISTNAIADALPVVSGFSTSGTLIRKYTNEQVTAGPNQQVTDSNGNYLELLIGNGYPVKNVRTGEWSYTSRREDGTHILIYDEILLVDNTGLTKDYEIFEPSETTQFKDEVFLIQMDKNTSSTLAIYAYAVPIPPDLSIPDLNIGTYNDTFSNVNVLTRHMGGIAQSIVNSLSDGNDQFAAQVDVPSVLNLLLDDSQLNTWVFELADTTFRRLRFNDTTTPFSDPNNNYDELTGLYTAPQGGYYHFTTEVEITNNTVSGEDYIQQIAITKFSELGDVLEIETDQTTILNSTSHTFNLSRTFYLQGGEQVGVVLKQRFGLSGLHLNQYVDWNDDYIGYGRNEGDTFGCVALYNGGGVMPVEEAGEVRLLGFESELSVDRSTFDSILANPFKYYHTNFAPAGTNPMYESGFIGKISRGILNGECTMSQFKKMDGV